MTQKTLGDKVRTVCPLVHQTRIVLVECSACQLAGLTQDKTRFVNCHGEDIKRPSVVA